MKTNEKTNNVLDVLALVFLLLFAVLLTVGIVLTDYSMSLSKPIINSSFVALILSIVLGFRRN